mgnify:CR=1 FL=1
MGRREVRTLLKQFSLVTAYAGGDDVRKSEANTKGSIGRDPGGPAGVREHVTQKEKRQELGRPLRLLLDQVGLFN